MDGRSSRHLPLAPRRPSPPRSALTLPPTSAPGLGIFFDTFQNLDHSHHHKHPYVYAMLNDGTKSCAPPQTHDMPPCACFIGHR